MSEINYEKKVGRPFKMKIWVEKLQEVLENENILFLSDNDLRFLVNEKLEPQCQITRRTLENWKAGKFHADDESGKAFMKCIEMALIRQKQYLGMRMFEDNKNWTKFAWVLERKFSDEFRLKYTSENINRNEQMTSITITAGNEDQKNLIDSIINGQIIDHEEVEPIVLPKNNVKDDEYDL